MNLNPTEEFEKLEAGTFLIKQEKKGSKKMLYCLSNEEFLVEKTPDKKEKSKMKISNFKSIIYQGGNSFSLVTAKNDSYNFKCSSENDFHSWSFMLNYLIFEKNKTNVKTSLIDGLKDTLIAGVGTTFTIQSMDSLGRPVLENSNEWKVFITKNGKFYLVDVIDQNEGFYKVGYILTESGNYQMKIQIRDEMIIKDITVLPDKFKTHKISIPQIIESGESNKGYITLYDKYSNKVYVKDFIKVKSEEESYELSNFENSHMFECQFKKAKDYILQVDIGENQFYHIIQVQPSMIKDIYIDFPKEIISLSEYVCYIQLKDEFDNPIKAINQEIKIFVNEKFAKIQQDNDQKFYIKILFEFSGEYMAEVFLDGDEFEGSPFKIICLKDSTEDQRLKEKMEQEEMEKKDKIKENIEYKIQYWTKGLSFRNLLDETVLRYFNQDIVSVYRIHSNSSEEEIMKTYRKSLFILHPDHSYDISPEMKLEYEILFTTLTNRYERFKKHKY